MGRNPIKVLWDSEKKEHYEASSCHGCNVLIDHRHGYYQDSLGRWEFCTSCYIHVPHPGGETVGWWYALERSMEIQRAQELKL